MGIFQCWCDLPHRDWKMSWFTSTYKKSKLRLCLAKNNSAFFVTFFLLRIFLPPPPLQILEQIPFPCQPKTFVSTSGHNQSPNED